MPKEKREELARLTGISATNLSAINTGNMPMTRKNADRIVRAVPGVSVLDAPEEAAPEEAVTLRDRLEALAMKLAVLTEEHNALQKRVVRLEGQAVPRKQPPAAPKDR